MATKRRKGEKWEYVVKRAGILDKPVYLTFASEDEGDEYCRKLEALLDRGIVPSEYQYRPRVLTIEHLARQYLREASVSKKDQEALSMICKTVGAAPCSTIDANWVDDWIARMKRIDRYAPATIRSRVGALARATDWGMRKKLVLMPDHPLRSLPDGYSQYAPGDVAAAGIKRVDVERDRRLEPGEETRIRAVIASGLLPRKMGAYAIAHTEDVLALFDLALETAMRMREMFTLTAEQIDTSKRTIHLDKTKNGDKRQVPLSSVAMRVVSAYAGKEGAIFPWLAEQKGNLKLTTNYLSKLFRQIFAAAECPNLHFHDLRHEATSRLFERTTLSTEQIMKITGHKSHSMVMRYLKLRGSDLAQHLW
jgi:integrase